MSDDRPDFDVFISHAAEDRPFAGRLADELRKTGVRAWYDQGQIRVGDSVLRQIEHALEHSHYYVVVVSPNYLSSAWTQFELGVALGRGGRKQILPLYFRTSPAEVRDKLPMVTDRAGISADAHSLGEVARMIHDTVSRFEKPEAVAR